MEGKEIIRCKLNGKNYRKENCWYPDADCDACPGLEIERTEKALQTKILNKKRFSSNEDIHSNKKPKQASSKLLPSALNYWNGWAVCNSQSGIMLLIYSDDAPKHSIKENDFMKHQLRVSRGDMEYICRLIDEDPGSFDAPVIKHWLPIHIKRLRLLSVTDDNARRKIEMLYKTLKKDRRGLHSPEQLKKIIERDIRTFKNICKIKTKNKNKPLEKIILKDRTWQIYKAYKNALDQWIAKVPDADEFFNFLNICKDNIESPVCIVSTRDYIYLKGQTTKDTFLLSY